MNSLTSAGIYRFTTINRYRTSHLPNYQFYH